MELYREFAVLLTSRIGRTEMQWFDWGNQGVILNFLLVGYVLKTDMSFSERNLLY